MPEHHATPSTANLIEPAAEEHQAVMRQWRRSESGMDGERGPLPATPDDAVAYKLLDAAGDALHRRDWQRGINILKLIVKDYRHTQEAACARSALDHLASQYRGR